MADPVSSATELFAHVLITTFSVAITALNAAGTVTAFGQFFSIPDLRFAQIVAIGISAYAQLFAFAHSSDQGHDYAYCIWMSSITIVAIIVGVATGVMLSFVLGHLVGIAADGMMERISLLRQSERKEDLVVAHLGIILVYLAAILTLLGAVYVSTAWLGSGTTS